MIRERWKRWSMVGFGASFTDAAAWNAFVERAPYHAFPQLWEWGEVRAMGGWRPVRLAIGASREAPVAGAQLLRQAGYEVIEAPDGRQALQQATQHPNLILLDVQMPGLNGFETATQIHTTLEPHAAIARTRSS